TADPEAVASTRQRLQEAQRLLAAMVPKDANQPYDMSEVVRTIVDPDSFFEMKPEYAPQMLVGFARLGGHAVGVVANNPNHLAGVLDIEASVKAARFVRFCDAFNLPLITFVDVP